MESLDKLIEKLSDEREKETNINRFVDEDFEQKSRLEPVNTDRITRRRRKKNQSSDEGYLDVEDKLALDAIRLRETLDPSRFYKKKSTDEISKNFKIGTVIHHPIDHYSGRATRKETRPNLVDELISDQNFKRNLKKRYDRLKSKKVVKNNVRRIIDKKRHNKKAQK